MAVDRHGFRVDHNLGETHVRTRSMGFIDMCLSIGEIRLELGTTHLVDPIPGMITWLESIASDAQVARWLIEHEGTPLRSST